MPNFTNERKKQLNEQRFKDSAAEREFQLDLVTQRLEKLHNIQPLFDVPEWGLLKKYISEMAESLMREIRSYPTLPEDLARDYQARIYALFFAEELDTELRNAVEYAQTERERLLSENREEFTEG